MTSGQRDSGSIVLIALVTLMIGGSAIAALTSFNSVLVRTQLPRERRMDLEIRADAALSLTRSVLQRRGVDPADECPSAPIQEPSDPSSPFTTDVTISCTSATSQSRVLQAGLVTTLNSSTVAAQQIPSWAGNIAQAIQGAVVINTGTLSSPSVSILPDRRLQQDPQSTTTWTTRTSAWHTFAAGVDVEPPVTYPPLPPVPLFERPGSQASIGTCSIYFPGRYLGTSSLTLSGGVHYFTSGVYYFERNLTISNGARVVMGDGRHPGCTTDISAVSTSRSPRRHAIEGRGVTLLFGGTARLFVQNSSLIVNSRNDGHPSIRTIGFGTSTTTVVIPADTVKVDDQTMVAAATHSRLPPESATAVAYKTSTLSPASDIAMSITLNGANPETNRVIIDGRIFVPHGGVHIASTTSTYALALTGGVVTTRLTSSLPLAPSGNGTEFTIGSALPESSSGVVTIGVTVDDGSRTYTSSESFDTGSTSWTLVGRSHIHARRRSE